MTTWFYYTMLCSCLGILNKKKKKKEKKGIDGICLLDSWKIPSLTLFQRNPPR